MRTQITRSGFLTMVFIVRMVFYLLLQPSLAQHRGHNLPPPKVNALFDRVSIHARAQQQAYWQQCLRSREKPNAIYHVIAISPFSRQYHIADWKRVPTLRKTEVDGGICGEWAQVVEKGLNARGVWSDQGGFGLYHYRRGRWQQVAFHEGLGYESATLRKARVPAAILSRLKLSLREE